MADGLAEGRILPEVGLQLPVHATSFGKAILAFQPPQALEDLTAEKPPKLTKRTLSIAALKRELEAVRAQGVATERDEAVLGEDAPRPRRDRHGGTAAGSLRGVGYGRKPSAARGRETSRNDLD